MKKAALFLLGTAGLGALWYGEGRRFYCVGNAQCLTVWKTFGNTCYLVPGHYYGLLPPTDNYIATTNTGDFTAYFSPVLPATAVFKLSEPGRVINRTPNVFRWVAYETRAKTYDRLFFAKNATKANDLQPTTFLIEANLLEGYATGKDGKHL